MKKIYIVTILAALIGFSACRKLDVPVESQYVVGNFPATAADYAASLGTMYSNLASKLCHHFSRMRGAYRPMRPSFLRGMVISMTADSTVKCITIPGLTITPMLQASGSGVLAVY